MDRHFEDHSLGVKVTFENTFGEKVVKYIDNGLISAWITQVTYEELLAHGFDVNDVTHLMLTDTAKTVVRGDMIDNIYEVQEVVIGHKYTKVYLKRIEEEEYVEYDESYDTGFEDGYKKGILESGITAEKLNPYLYRMTYLSLQEEEPTDFYVGGCSSFVQDGLLYRNFDFNYNEKKSFIVDCEDFSGLAFGDLSDITSLPYKVVDGCNNYGIRIATHIIFNDWNWNNYGSTSMSKLPFIALTTMKSIDDVYNLPLNDLKKVPSLGDYLAQYIITDGETTYAILPSTEDNTYVVEDITDNPKLTNFRWVEQETVTRDMLQTRPTGVERWNMMPCDLNDLRFTLAYESNDRLSEFIGINGTTKDSTDEELEVIYEEARETYLDRERDGQTWQTVHSVVYDSEGMKHLFIQENWTKDYTAQGGGGGAGSWNELSGKPFETIGQNLKVVNGHLAVDTATAVEEDNTRPITSAAVHVEVGNINVLLQTI